MDVLYCVFIILLPLGSLIDVSVGAVGASDPCNSVTDCGQCTRTPGCVWCRQEDFEGKRCHSRNDTGDGDGPNCSPQFIVDSYPRFRLVRHNPLTKGRGVRQPVQLTPQHVSLTNMRVGQAYNITVQFKPAEDYPVDLYFLMDSSNSMRDDRDNLVRLSSELAKTMKEITIYYQLGFGSFIDKNVSPFVQGECSNNQCTSPYSFRNYLPLTNDTQKFTKGVESSAIIGNFDNPEGGFEALVQAIVCKKAIGWRSQARHIIVLATDDYAHLAGDGRVGGILKPNDGACHLNSEGLYTHWMEQDHPSLGQLAWLARDNAINVIFAVTRNKVNPYKDFARMVTEFRAVDLDRDSSNIVELVREQYKLITSTVDMSARIPASAPVRIRYFTSCLDEYINNGVPPALRENSTCDGLQVGEDAKPVTFTISIEVIDRPKDLEDRNQTITIYPVGINEFLTVDLEIVWNCPCELADNKTCPSLCKDYEFCVKCDLEIQKLGEGASEECLMRQNCTEKIVPHDGPVHVIKVSDRKCVITNADTGCKTEFVYGFNSYGVGEVRYSTLSECPPKIEVSHIAFGLMAALVAVGLGLLLLWRLLLFLYDRQEYARFLKESENAKWSTANNPLYVEASTTFANPAFNGGKN